LFQKRYPEVIRTINTMSSPAVYSAVPINAPACAEDVASLPLSREGGRTRIARKIKFVILFLISFISVRFACFAMFKAAASKKLLPTLSPGGGRDWTLDLENRVIACKHNPELVLGSLPLDPLILTTRDSGSAIYFPKEDLERLSKGKSVLLKPLSLQFPEHVDRYQYWDYALTGVNKNENEKGNILAEYVNNNFLMLEGIWAMDVSFWKFEVGNTVNFVKAMDHPQTKWWEKKPKTLQEGGGRDWVLNVEDGTISPKKYPFLVLGRGFKSLKIVESDSDGVWKFEEKDLLSLQNGGTMRLKNLNGDIAVKKDKKEQYVDMWRYIQSEITHSSNDKDVTDAETEVVELKYIENNYLSIYQKGVPEEKSLVLDVAFWIMWPYNVVNFVGGWIWKDEDEEDNDE
jgi:hypothetical protein